MRKELAMGPGEFHRSAMSYYDAGFWAAIKMSEDGRAHALLGLVRMAEAITARRSIKPVLEKGEAGR